MKCVHACLCLHLLTAEGRMKVAGKRVFSPRSFSDYCCFGSWRPVMETWLSGKFVAVCRGAALHSNQQLSTQPGPLLMTATNCLANSRHYLRASVKRGYTLSVCRCGLMASSRISNNSRNNFWTLSHFQELTRYASSCNGSNANNNKTANKVPPLWTARLVERSGLWVVVQRGRCWSRRSAWLR